VQPGRLGHEVLGVGAADREAEVIVAVVDDALPDHAIARPQRSHATSDLCDLAGPLVARMIGYETGMIVAALVELEVRVADATLRERTSTSPAAIVGMSTSRNRGALRFGEHQCLHPSALLIG